MTTEKEFPQRWFVPPGYKIRTKRYYPEDVEVMPVAEHTAITAMLQTERDRYKKALEFYASPHEKIKDGRSEFGCGCCAGNIIDEDNDYDSSVVGQTAREALAPPVNQEATGDKEE